MKSQNTVAEKLQLFKSVNKLTVLNDKWLDILENEDFDLYILELREELITRVLDECNRNYIERTCFKYVVECAYDAWKKLVNVHYFVHDNVDEVFRSDSTWIPDQEPDICESDTWSNGNILLKKYDPPKKSIDEVKTVMSDYQLIKCLEYPPDNIYESYVSLDDIQMPDANFAETVVAPVCNRRGVSAPNIVPSQHSLRDDISKSSLLLTTVASENKFDKLIAQVKVKLPEYATSQDQDMDEWLNADIKVEEARKLCPVSVRYTLESITQADIDTE